MSIYKSNLTQSRLKQILHYNPDTGEWTWIQGSKRAPAGSIAGCINTGGYRMIRINKKLYQSSRLAVLYMNGSIPEKEVDHINRNPNDDRWCNLRLATHSENGCNRRVQSNNVSGYKGVYLYKRTGKYQSFIKIRNENIYLGTYDKIEDAIEVRKKAEEKYHGEFAI